MAQERLPGPPETRSLGPGLNFRLLGTPVRVDPTFVILGALLGFSGGRGPLWIAEWILVVFVSILWHEMGHAVAFRAYGHAPRILLHSLGGETSSDSPRRLRPRQDILISLAGPGAGLLLGAAVLLAARGLPAAQGSVGQVVTADLLWVNVGWGLLNLAPILPLDGGRVLAAVLDLATGGRGRTPALVVSITLAGAAAAAAFAAGWTFVAVLVGWLGLNDLLELTRNRQARRDAAHLAALDEGYERLAHRDSGAAAEIAGRVRAEARTAEVRGMASMLAMWANLLEGRIDEAAKSVADLSPGSVPSPVIPPGMAEALGGEDGLGALLGQVFRAHPGDVTGLLLARGLVETGRLEEALELLDGAQPPVGAHAEAAIGGALFQLGRYPEAARICERIFERDGEARMAFEAASCWGRAGERGRALAWLRTAVERGYRDAGALESDPAFEGLRDTPEFEEIRERLGAAARSGGGRPYGRGRGG